MKTPTGIDFRRSQILSDFGWVLVKTLLKRETSMAPTHKTIEVVLPGDAKQEGSIS